MFLYSSFCLVFKIIPDVIYVHISMVFILMAIYRIEILFYIVPISFFVYIIYFMRCRFTVGSAKFISLKIISWSLSPIGRVFVLFTIDGLFMNRRSSVLSFLVDLSITCVRLWSFNISNSCWWSDLSGLLGITAGMSQSIWPKLKLTLS